MNFTEEEIGGLVFVRKHGDLYIPYLVLYVALLIIGCSGNLLIMSAIVFTKELQNTTNMLIFNLSLAEFFISFFVDGFTVVGILAGKRFFDMLPGFCDLIAASCLVFCSTSMINIGLLSVNRYVNICHHSMYKKIFERKKTFLYCFITWICGILVDLPCVLGWGGHTYNINTLNCVWDRTKNHGYTLFFPLSTIVLPCICVFACYTKIFIHVNNSKNRVANTTGVRTNDTRKAIHIAKGLFTSFSVFFFCWVPYGLLVMTDWYFTFPAAAEMYTMMVAHLNSAANAVVYAIYNPMFQKGYKNVFRILTGGKLFKITTTIETTRMKNTNIRECNQTDV